MTVVTDILDWFDSLKSVRIPWEKVWRDCARYAMPLTGRMDFAPMSGGGSAFDAFVRGPTAEERGRDVYDDTAIWGMDRLNAGLESLVTPRSQQWHGAGFDTPELEETHDEKEWFEKYVQYLFRVRYNPACGFELANQSAIRSASILGLGLYYISEAWGGKSGNIKRVPMSYSYCPLWHCFLDVNSEGEHDTVFRCFPMSARAIAGRWPDTCSAKVKKAAESTSDKGTRYEVLHVVMPRREAGSRGNLLRNSAYGEYWVEPGGKTLLDDGGAYEFPYGIYEWDRDADQPYGQSMVMASLAKIKSLNVMGKNNLKAFQQWTSPPVALAASADGVTNRPNLNPDAQNPGLLDSQGNLMIKPIITALSPEKGATAIEAERATLRETLYINLWQILIKNPDMTATEAMIRADEKGELIGPVGAKIQRGLARVFERETGILGRKGAFRGEFKPPPRIAQGSFGLRFTSPLDRLRRAKEVVGAERVMQSVLAASQLDPRVVARFDADKFVKLVQDVTEAPADILRDDKEFEAMAANNDQMQRMMAGLQAAGVGAKAFESGAKGAKAVSEAQAA
jgi:hypothetical protein